jgi:hypothetical protein
MRRWIIGVVAATIAGAFACAELVGVHELTCAADEAGPFDTCVGEGGVTLGSSGEVHGLAWANGTIVAVGYDVLDSGAGLAVRVFSPTGDVVDELVQDAGAANAVRVDPTPTSVWVVGGDGARFMIRHVALTPSFALTSGTTDYGQTVDEHAPLSDSVAFTPGNQATMFGTTTNAEFAIQRVYAGGGAFHSALFKPPVAVHATSGVSAGPAITILGDTPDASFGLAMARWQNGTDPSGGPGTDKTFGNDGGIVVKFGDGGSARSLLLASDGASYWVGGVAAGDAGFVLAHVTDGGAVDQSWTAAGNGSGANALLAVDGGILAAGFADGNLAIARFTLDAGIDKTFGDAGVLEIPLPGELKAIVQTDNRYVVGGFTTKNGPKQWVLVWLIP